MIPTAAALVAEATRLAAAIRADQRFSIDILDQTM